MGAHDISFTMDGTPNFNAIKERFKRQQAEDRQYNGHQEGYSGDFQTVHEVKDHTHKIFDSYGEAHSYCIENATKWQDVIAVRYRFLGGQYKASQKVIKLHEKISELGRKQLALERQSFKLPRFVTCEGCRSKVASDRMVDRIKMGSTKCPVCGEGDFRPLGLTRKIQKLKSRIEILIKQHREAVEKEKAALMKKHGKVGTLVAGWGAS